MIKKTSFARKGQSLVELTLTITMMMFLLLATIDFGFAFLYWITIRDAAQEGAMYGSLHPGTGCESVLRNWVRDAADSPIVNISALPDEQILITRSGSTPTLPSGSTSGSAPGSAIKIQVTHKYHILTPMISLFAADGENILISASISDTVLQVDSSCP